jgi:phosphomevalonate kinase
MMFDFGLVDKNEEKKKLVKKLKKWYKEARKNDDREAIRAYRRRLEDDERFNMAEKSKMWDEIVGAR